MMTQMQLLKILQEITTMVLCVTVLALFTTESQLGPPYGTGKSVNLNGNHYVVSTTGGYI